MTQPASEAWLPHKFISSTRRLSRDAFTRLHRSHFFLVIVLDSLSSEVALGLSQCGTTAQRHDMSAQNTGHFGAPGSDRFLMDARRFSGGTRPSVATLSRLHSMLSMPCFVVPLQKPGVSPFLASFTVGRSHEQDIVLRHPSVSKLHARLSILEDELFVEDNASRNHTHVNHEPISSRTVVNSGDTLRFGWVEGVACTSDALWRAAQVTQ